MTTVPANSHEQLIHATFHIAMLVFIFLAVYAMVFDQLKYWGLAILIILLYLYRLATLVPAFRAKYNAPLKHAIHRLDQIRVHTPLDQEQDNDNSMLKKSFLVRSYEQQNGSRQLSNRHQNSLNRSRMEKSLKSSSFRKIKSPNDSMERGGNFLTDLFSEKLEQSIVKSRLSQSFIRNIDAKSEEQKLIKENKNATYQKLNQDYVKTIKNTLKADRAEIDSRYSLLNGLIVEKCRQVYAANIDNLQAIIHAIQSNYHVRINACEYFPELHPIYDSSSPMQTYELSEAVFELMNGDFRNGILPFPRRKVQNRLTAYPNVTWKEAGLVREEKQDNKVSGEAQKKIQKLRADRLKYDKMLNWGNDKIKTNEILLNLRHIREFIEIDGHSGAFIKEDTFGLTENESRRQMAALNTMKQHINSHLQEDQMLIFEDTSYFTALIGKTNRSKWEMRKNVEASNYGHPHYNLVWKDRAGSGAEEVIACECGSKNGVSVLYIYLHMLARKQPILVRDNPKLNQLISTIRAR